MPEMPEVETVVRMLRKLNVENRVISRVLLADEKCITEPELTRFHLEMVKRRIKVIGRRGKYIIMTLDKGYSLLIHLRMTGRILLSDEPDGAHVRAAFKLDDGRWLQFFDTRRFGEIRLTKNPLQKLEKLGPEPLEPSFTVVWFGNMLQTTGRAIKAVLLDQHKMAGLGNIYCDEALWEAGIHPLRPANSLNPQEVKKLHRAVRKVLRKGIRNFGTTLGHGLTNFQLPAGDTGQNCEKLNVYGRTGKACPRCSGEITRIKVAQRGTHICISCQKI